MLGFPNEYYFNTYFKKAVGLPPGAYRNINLKAE
jgi:AraC-like DNA-binding protein